MRVTKYTRTISFLEIVTYRQSTATNYPKQKKPPPMWEGKIYIERVSAFKSSNPILNGLAFVFGLGFINHAFELVNHAVLNRMSAVSAVA